MNKAESCVKLVTRLVQVRLMKASDTHSQLWSCMLSRLSFNAVSSGVSVADSRSVLFRFRLFDIPALAFS